ncbi:hypothetical protein ACFX2G_013533 [Malus domestica]
MHWKSCTHPCTNASITLPAKYKFKNNPVTRAYINWWSNVHYENLGTASGTNSSCLCNDAPREGCSVISTHLIPLDCASVAPLQDGPVVLVPQRPCLSPRHPDSYEEADDEVDLCKDGFALQQRQQIINK